MKTQATAEPQVRASANLQVVVHQPAGMRNIGISVGILYPHEEPEDRFGLQTVLEVIEVPMKGRTSYGDIVNVADIPILIQKFEEFTDGMPVTQFLEHILAEILSQKNCIKTP